MHVAADGATILLVRDLHDGGERIQRYSVQRGRPTFGIWGFALASPAPLAPLESLSADISGELRYLTDETMQSLFNLPADLNRVETDVNRLDSQVLVRYYEEEWARWN